MNKKLSFTLQEIRSGSAPDLQLTPAQRRALEMIAEALPHFDFYGRPDAYQVKEFTVIQYASDDETDARVFAETNFRPSIYVNIVTGLANDEGTAAEIYCRKYRSLAIGPRGGIKAMQVPHAGKPGHGYRAVSLFDAMNTEYWN